MVLHHEIKQHGRLLLYGRVKFLPIKRLINLSDTTLERLVFLVCKPLASTKLNLQSIDGLHRIVVSGMERGVGCSLLNGKRLVVIMVERVEGIHIIANDIEQPAILLVANLLLQPNGTRHQTHHILQLFVTVELYLLVNGIPLNDVLLQNCVSPLSECDALFTFHTIPNRSNHL